MFLEYDWTFNVYRPRIGTVFTDVRGERSWPSMREAKAALALCGLKVGSKTDSRSWKIEAIERGQLMVTEDEMRQALLG